MTASALDPLALLLCAVALVNAALGAVVLWQSRREQNAAFALTAFCVALWTLTNALFRVTNSTALATLWAQLSYVAALGTAAAFLHFAWSFPQPTGSLRGRRLVWSLGTGVAALAFVPGAIIERVDVPLQRIVTAPGVYLVALFMLATSGYAFALFFRNQKHLRRKQQAQARLVLYGSSLTALLGLFFNLLLPLLGDYRFVWLGPLSSLFFVGFCAYAIVATHLFDVRLLIRRTFVYSLLLALLAGSFAVLEKGMEHLIGLLLGQRNSFAGDLVAALLVSVAADPLKRWLRHLASTRFFQGEEAEGQIQERARR